MKKVIILTENQINEITNIAVKSNVTVCSLNEFKSIVSKLGINDDNVEEFIGKYCFIEIGSSWGRVKAEMPIAPPEYDENGVEYETKRFYNEGQWYFKNEHHNVLKIEFDDNQKFNNKKNNTMTAVNLQPHETRNGRGTRFYFENGKDFTEDMAFRIKQFVENNISYGENVKFIIHCKQGKSMSAAIGSYVAKKINQFTDTFFDEYDNVETGKSQFNIGVGRKGEPKYPHQNAMNRLGHIEGWNKKNAKPNERWWYNTIRNHPKTGYNDQRKEWEKFHPQNNNQPKK